MSLNDIANVSVSSTTKTPTRTGFGVPMVAAYHTKNADRVRSYATLAAILADGFRTSDPAYRLAAAVFAQNPAPPRVKIGRRASAFTQVVHLTPGTPAAGDVFTAKVDGMSASATADGTPTVSEVCTALAASLNALGVADAIIATGASSGGSQTLTGASLDGSVGGGAISPPRALVLTLSASGNWLATTATVTGKDIDGNVITDTFAIPGGGGAAVLGTGGKHFAKVTSVAIPAQGGPGGTFTLGTRAPVTAVATGGTHVVCTAPVAGELHSYELVAGNLTIADHTADPGIAADLAAIQTADADFYGLCLDSNSSAEILAAAAWVESNGKLLVVQSADSACADPSDTTNVLYALKAAAYALTAGFFYPVLGTATGCLAAAMLGSRLPADPGSDTWAFKTLAGVTALPLTDTAHGAVLANNGNTYEAVAGVNITYPGKVAAGEWVDVVRGLAWFKARLRERIFGAQISNPKIPFTDTGIDTIRLQVQAQLTEGQRVGLIANDTKPTITTPRAADVSAEDRAARNLPGVTFTARLAGAILTSNVSGTVTA